MKDNGQYNGRDCKFTVYLKKLFKYPFKYSPSKYAIYDIEQFLFLTEIIFLAKRYFIYSSVGYAANHLIASS